MADATQYCTFHLGPLYLGIEVLRVQEVIREQPMTRLPLAPHEISGLINLRGQIVTAIDLRQRFGLPPRDPGRPPMNVVVRSEDGAVSFLVDDIGDVIDTDPKAFERAPRTLQGAARELIRGVYKLPAELLLVLDCDRALEVVSAGAGRPA
jgi:purine-binding chemotaxis protein CheW